MRATTRTHGRAAAWVAGLLAAAVVLVGCSSAGAPGPVPSVAGRSSSSAGRAPLASDAGAHQTAPASTRTAAQPLASRCPATRANQVVVVSLAVQHMWLCHHGRTVRSYPVTTGRAMANTRTPTGTFHIQGRNRNSVLTLSSDRQFDVKYWIPFDAPDFGFHDAPWQHFPFGSARYRTHGSHGCVHMPLHAIAFFYRWVEIGATVRITAA